MSIAFSLAHGCVLVAALLPIACAGIAKAGRLGLPRRDGGYDNHDPRAWLARQNGYRARANAAQANSFEGLPFFIGAVALALQMGAPMVWVNGLALAYVLLRLVYIALYLLDWPWSRSVIWTLGIAVNVALLLVSP